MSYPVYKEGTSYYIYGSLRRQTSRSRPHRYANGGERDRDKIRRGRLHPPRSSLLQIPPSPCEGAEGRWEGVYSSSQCHGIHGEGGATPSYRRRREEGGACRGGARAGAPEAELVVAGHRARRGVGAPAQGHAPRRHGSAARAERHGRRPRRAPRVHRSGVRLRAAPRRVRLRGVRRRRREEPPPGDAARARPLLRRPRRGGRVHVLVRRRVGGVLRGVAARQPHVHTLSRRHAGDGEDAAEAVGAGGCAVHAEPPLSSRGRPPPPCIGRRENQSFEMQNSRRKESPVASSSRKRRRRKKKEKNFC